MPLSSTPSSNLLNEKGIIAIEELDERKKQIAARLVKKFVESGIGLLYQGPEYDKYTFEHEADVDYQSKLPVCKAVCCKLPFALSRQDVEEDIIRWEFERMYLIAHGDDCVLLTGICTNARCVGTEKCQGITEILTKIHTDLSSGLLYTHTRLNANIDCRGSEIWKVWLDYNKEMINSELVEKIDWEIGEFCN